MSTVLPDSLKQLESKIDLLDERRKQDRLELEQKMNDDRIAAIEAQGKAFQAEREAVRQEIRATTGTISAEVTKGIIEHLTPEIASMKEALDKKADKPLE